MEHILGSHRQHLIFLQPHRKPYKNKKMNGLLRAYENAIALFPFDIDVYFLEFHFE